MPGNFNENNIDQRVDLQIQLYLLFFPLPEITRYVRASKSAHSQRHPRASDHEVRHCRCCCRCHCLAVCGVPPSVLACATLRCVSSLRRSPYLPLPLVILAGAERGVSRNFAISRHKWPPQQPLPRKWAQSQQQQHCIPTRTLLLLLPWARYLTTLQLPTKHHQLYHLRILSLPARRDPRLHLQEPLYHLLPAEHQPRRRQRQQQQRRRRHQLHVVSRGRVPSSRAPNVASAS